MLDFQIGNEQSMRHDVHSSQENRPMIDFKGGMGFTAGSGPDLDRSWTGPGIFAEIWPGPDPARPPPLSAAEHAPTPTHPHTPAHVDAIDFNTPRLISFGKKNEKKEPTEW